MADTDFERLTIELQASNVALSKSLATIASDVDKRLLGIEKRTETMSRRVTSSFNAAGRQFSRIGTTLFGGAALVGISRFVSRVVDVAGKIQDTAEALGVSTDALQAWGIMAGRAGVNQDTFNSALDRFSKNLGDAQLKGGDFAKLLNNIGVGTTGTAEEVFLRLADAVKATGNQEQKVAITTAALGKSEANLVPILQQGSAAIREQTQEFVRNGSVITRDNIAKIDELGDKWADLKRQLQATAGNVLGGFTDEFGKFADTLSSPQFQESLKNFGALMAQVAVAVAKAAPFLPNIAGALAGARVGRVLGTPGAIGGAVLGGLAPELLSTQTASVEALDKELQYLKATLASLPEEAQVFTAGQINSLEKQIEVARELRRKAAQAAGIPLAATGTPAAAAGGAIDRTGALNDDLDAARKAVARALAEQKQAEAQLASQVAQATAEALRGQLPYYDAVREQIRVTTETAVAAAEEKKNADIAALDETKLGLKDYATIVQSIEKRTEAEKKEIREKGREDANRINNQQIEDEEELSAQIIRLHQDRRRAISDERRSVNEAQRALAQEQTQTRIIKSEERGVPFEARAAAERAAIEQNLEFQKEALAEAEQARIDALNDELRQVEDHEIALGAIRDEFRAKRKEADERASQDHIILDRIEQEARLSAVSDFFGNLATLSQSGSEELKAIGKAAAIADATIRGIQAVNLALTSPLGFPANFALAASVGVMTAANVARIAAMEKGGIVGPGGEMPLRRYARGGVASSPQMAVFGEGSMNEAFVPLPDGRRIPVTLKMPALPAGSGRQGPMHLTIRQELALAGANGDEAVRRLASQGAREGAALAVQQIRRQLPDLMVRAEKRKL